MFKPSVSGTPCFLSDVYLQVDGRPSAIFLLPILLIKLQMKMFSMLQIKMEHIKVGSREEKQVLHTGRQKPPPNTKNPQSKQIKPTQNK